MRMTTDIAIIGAGPYGLSLGAHLIDAGLDVRVFGEPMSTWLHNMPEGMVLKSEGFASDLWHPAGKGTLKAYCEERSIPYQHSGLPVPLKVFSDYGIDFQHRYVPSHDPRRITALGREGDAFVLRLDDDEIVTAKRVVVAAGIGPFHYTPPELESLRGPMLTHSIQHHSLHGFAGKNVLVIGGGASGVELAALMSQNGAAATVAARRTYIPYCSPRGPRSVWDRIKAPETGLGTGWRSVACVYAPMLFYEMPRDFRHMVVRKHLGPAPGWTSRAVVEQNVNVILGASVNHAKVRGDLAEVTFDLGGGGRKTVKADHVVSATGFRVDVRRLEFLSPSLLSALTCADYTPVLSRHFETSIPGLFMVGVAAANCFGPLLRFAYGAGFASSRLSKYLVKTTARKSFEVNAKLARA